MLFRSSRTVPLNVVLCTILLASCGVEPVREPSIHPAIVTIAGANSRRGGFADGPATEARFDCPEGLALDRAGENLYVADSANHAIRRINLVTNEVTTIAGVGGMSGSADGGLGTARLNTPRNLVLDADEANLYFTDTHNNVIRGLELSSGEVTTEFGTPGEPGSDDGIGTAARFGGTVFAPWGGGLAFYESGGSRILFVADSANQTIRAIDMATREVTTVAGMAGQVGHVDGAGDVARFNKPAGLAVVRDQLYVTEANGLTIRAIDLASYVVRTAAGRAPADPGHFCENVSPVIPEECGSVDAELGIDARFRFPFGIANAGAALFIADSHNNLIRAFDTNTTSVTTVAGIQHTVLDDIPHASEDSTQLTPGTFWHPTHVAFHPPNTLYVADRSAQCIRRVELLEAP